MTANIIFKHHFYERINISCLCTVYMGFFDYIIAPSRCSHCGYDEREHSWQTKALNNAMFTFKIGDRIEPERFRMVDGEIEIHTVCKNCSKPVSCWIRIRNQKLTDEIVC